MNKKQILIDGKIISYIENLQGSKDTALVFLHGWMQDSMSFADIFAKLDTENIPYISLDLPGFGGSQVSHSSMTIEEYGEIVIKVIEKLSLSKPVLIGHSFGGRISIYLGSFYKNISRIILIGAAGISTPINPFRLFIVKSGKLILSLPGLQKIKSAIKGAICSSDYRNSGKMEQIFRNTISNDLRKYMGMMKYPTLMIYGKDDDQVPVSEATIMHSHIQGSDFILLEGGHFIHQEKAAEISKLIFDFVKK